MIMDIDDLPALPYRHISPDVPPSEGLKRISALLKTARGNADLLHEALVNAEGPRDLRGELIQEFLSRCRKTREIVQAQFPWLAAEARNSRGRGPSTRRSSESARSLKELESVDQMLLSVLQLYDELVRAGSNTEAQEHVKSTHTISMLTAASGMGSSSLNGVRQPPPPPPQRGHLPSSHGENINKLFAVCQTGRGNAELLRDALVNAQPAELDQALVQEFLKNCRDSQAEIFNHLPWADTEAAKSRRLAHSSLQTREEQLLESMLAADDALTLSLKMYDDYQRDVIPVMERSQQLDTASASPGTDSANLFALCRTARGNAELLNDALYHANPGDLDGDLIQEFHTKCQKSQEEIMAKIPWATAEAGEDLLGELLGSNEELNKALKLYDDVKHGGRAVSFQRSKISDPTTEEQARSTRISNQGQLEGSSSQSSKQDMNGLPPFTPQDRAKFTKIFLSSGPEDGILTGERARDILLKSQLPPETLLKIWDLADIRRRGILDVADFMIAMYLVQGCMTGQLRSIPDSLPPELYDVVSGKPLPREPISSLAPISATAQTSSTVPAAQSHVDRIFNTLDPQGTGRAQGYVVTSFMLKMGLSMEAFTKIWDSVDIGQKGYLTRDEFTRAMKLVDSSRADKKLPPTPPSPSTPHSSLGRNGARAANGLHPERSTEPLLIDLEDQGLSSSQSANSTAPPSTVPSTPLAIRSQHMQSTPPSTSSTTIGTRGVQANLTGSPFPGSPFSIGPFLPSASESSYFSAVPGQQQENGIQPINPVEKTRFDTFFDMLDKQKQGYIAGQDAVPFFATSKLPDHQMAGIWELADANHDGRLTKDEFAVAMHLILENLRGKEIPAVLPPFLSTPFGQPHVSPNLSTQTDIVPVASPPPSFADEATRSDTPPPPYEAIGSEQS